jgi:hypothetical protein
VSLKGVFGSAGAHQRAHVKVKHRGWGGGKDGQGGENLGGLLLAFLPHQQVGESQSGSGEPPVGDEGGPVGAFGPGHLPRLSQAIRIGRERAGVLGH